MSGYLWYRSKWSPWFGRVLQYTSGLEVLSCSIDTDFNYVINMLQSCLKSCLWSRAPELPVLLVTTYQISLASNILLMKQHHSAKTLNHSSTLSLHIQNHKLTAEHNFFATSHGKIQCDGIGRTINREAGNASLRAMRDIKL